MRPSSPWWILGLLLWLLPWPARADVTLVLPDGPLVPGQEGRVLVVVHRGGRPVVDATPVLDASRGEVTAREGAVQEGTYHFRYRPPGVGDEVVFTVAAGAAGSTRVSLPVSVPAGPSMAAPERTGVVAGAEAPEVLRFTSPDPVPADQALVVASEGTVEGTATVDGGLAVTWRPGSERYPRVAVVGILDLRDPERPPAWAVVRVAGRPRIPVRTEPGAAVRLVVGGRAYGPFRADASGVAEASVVAWPGEETAQVLIEDDAGNVQRSTLNLVREAQPLLAWLAAPGRAPGLPPAPVYLLAVDADGGPWRGTPACSVTPGGPVEPVPLGGGAWRLAPPPLREAEWEDPRVACELRGSTTRAELRLPAGEGVPQRLVLRAWPEALTADFPVAQVQAFLEDWRGVRLSPEGIRLQADLGEIRAEAVQAGALRGEYSGAAAAATGVDRIQATYALAPGSGAPVRLQVEAGPPTSQPAHVTVLARALDREGRPLPDLPLQLSAGAGARQATTDSRGWARAEVPAPPEAGLLVLEATHGSRVGRGVHLPLAPGPVPEVGAPDLAAAVEIPVLAGRVREVFLRTEPAVLYAGPGARARVLVRLVDRQGNPVADANVAITASAGVAGELRLRPDGTWEAWYEPPRDMRSGRVQLTVSGADGAFTTSTELSVEPRPLTRAAGVSVGGITNLGAIGSGAGVMTLEHRLPIFGERMLLRVAAGIYQDREEVLDQATGETLDFQALFFPLVVAPVVRQERGLLATWLGTGPTLVPWRSWTRFGDGGTFRGGGLSTPGLVLFTGLGYRLGGGEAILEAHYLLAGVPEGDVGYSGSVGGIATLGGYRVVF